MREQGAWLAFEDESGQSLRPPKARTWSRIGCSPQVRVSGKGSGRISLAGMVCARTGERTRLVVYRMLVHHSGRRGEKSGFRERDFAQLLDAAHQQLGGNIVLVWDNSSHHKDTLMRELLAARTGWLTVFLLPPYAPDLALAADASRRGVPGNCTPAFLCYAVRPERGPRSCSLLRQVLPRCEVSPHGGTSRECLIGRAP